MSQEDRKRKRGVLPQTFFSLWHFYFRNIKDRFFSTPSQTQQHIWIPVRHKSVYATTSFLDSTYARSWWLKPSFLNWSGTTARQLSLTGLHYFRVTKHWEMVITGSACPRPRGAAGLSHTTLCLRKEPQPERSKSQNGKETPQLLPCSESPTPPSAHVWPCCYGHCTQPPPLADHPHCGYKSEHLFLKNTKAITSWCSNTYSTIIYIICTTYINIPYCTMWLQGATNGH